MSSINTEWTLGQIVAEHPAAAAAFERFHIDYCCQGNRPLLVACQEQNIEPDEVLREIEQEEQQAAGRESDNTTKWLEQPLHALCDHIEQTHHQYLKKELPRLTQLIEKVVQVHGERHAELQKIQQVFASLRGELEPHMFKEERILFPAVRQLEQSESAPAFPFGTVANPIDVMEHEHDAAGAALAQLRELTNDFTPPDDACTAYRELWRSLGILEADLHQHIHKENNILFPRAIELEARRSSRS